MLFKNAFTQCFDRFAKEHVLDTYVFCLSNHDKEDDDGRLSMWRGYGANGNGAAIVIDMAKINVTETSPLIIAKVSYDTSDARRDWLRAKLQRCRQESGWKLGR